MKTNSQRRTTIRSSAGLSLAEMVAVIGVIGLFAAIAIPIFANATDEASSTRHRRNAQALALLANQAVAAGDLSIPAAGSVEEVVDLLLAGVSGTGALEGTLFKLHSLDEHNKAGAMRLLTWGGGVLQFHPAT
ncbi:MAG: hypothetical protein ACR2RV_29375 [Verrucomicrobiales bacterium]